MLSRKVFYYYAGDELQAVRMGDWKLHLPHDFLTPASPPGHDGRPANYKHMTPEAMSVSGLRGVASRHGYVVRHQGQALFDLKNDVGETRDVTAEHPEIVKQLQALAEVARAELGDSLTKRTGNGVRPAGQ
jgi:arylsulfatase